VALQLRYDEIAATLHTELASVHEFRPAYGCIIAFIAVVEQTLAHEIGLAAAAEGANPHVIRPSAGSGRKVTA